MRGVVEVGVVVIFRRGYLDAAVSRRGRPLLVEYVLQAADPASCLYGLELAATFDNISLLLAEEEAE